GVSARTLKLLCLIGISIFYSAQFALRPQRAAALVYRVCARKPLTLLEIWLTNLTAEWLGRSHTYVMGEHSGAAGHGSRNDDPRTRFIAQAQTERRRERGAAARARLSRRRAPRRGPRRHVHRRRRRGLEESEDLHARRPLLRERTDDAGDRRSHPVEY